MSNDFFMLNDVSFCIGAPFIVSTAKCVPLRVLLFLVRLARGGAPVERANLLVGARVAASESRKFAVRTALDAAEICQW
jgi:hypothetical protein